MVGLVFLGDDFEIRLDGVHAHDIVVLVEVHAVDAAGVAAHRANFRLAEKNRLAFVAGQEDHLFAVGELRADEFICAIEIDGDDPRRARIGKFRQASIFSPFRSWWP